MRALSLWQPWASLMAEGAKKIETRSWQSPYRGLVAIHAAKKWDDDLRSTALKGCFAARLAQGLPSAGFDPDSLPRGCFVAVGLLNRCLSTDEHKALIPSETADEFWFGDYSPGRFMWVFDEVWKLRSPVYAAGQQGLWALEGSVVDVIEEMLPEHAFAEGA